jgi:hypothetical protein
MLYSVLQLTSEAEHSYTMLSPSCQHPSTYYAINLTLGTSLIFSIFFYTAKPSVHQLFLPHHAFHILASLAAVCRSRRKEMFQRPRYRNHRWLFRALQLQCNSERVLRECPSV